jgi:hypothetical protein
VARVIVGNRFDNFDVEKRSPLNSKWHSFYESHPVRFVVFILIVILLLVRCSKPHDIIPATDGDSIETHPVGKYIEYEITPTITDPDIKETGNKHYAYLDTRIANKNTLLIFLGGTGSSPAQYHLFCRMASSLGYHVINIDYLNTIPGTVCRGSDDSECYSNYHHEMWFGVNVSDKLNVSKSNSLENRIVKLLTYLQTTHPEESWSKYITSGLPDYRNIVVTGHSQGGGHVTFIAFKAEVKKVISFSAPNDFLPDEDHSATWLRNTPVTHIQNFYVLNHSGDEIVSPAEQYQIVSEIGLLHFSDTVHLHVTTLPDDSHVLISDFDPNQNAVTGRLKHNSTIVDAVIPEGEAGKAILNSWIYLLNQ